MGDQMMEGGKKYNAFTFAASEEGHCHHAATKYIDGKLGEMKELMAKHCNNNNNNNTKTTTTTKDDDDEDNVVEEEDDTTSASITVVEYGTKLQVELYERYVEALKGACGKFIMMSKLH